MLEKVNGNKIIVVEMLGISIKMFYNCFYVYGDLSKDD